MTVNFESGRPLEGLLQFADLDKLRGLTDKELGRAHGCAETTVSEALGGIHAIGALLYWSNASADAPPVQDYISGASGAIQLLAEAAAGALQIHSTAGSLLRGTIPRQRPELQPVKNRK